MGFVYAKDPALLKLEAEARARSFMEFVHDVDNLKAVTVILTLCAKPKRTKEVVAYLRQLGASEERTYNALRFIREQRLDDGRRDDRVQAIPAAVEELVYRLEHDGNESPPKPAEDEGGEKLHRALNKVNQALDRLGYHTVGKRRLRVVR